MSTAFLCGNIPPSAFENISLYELNNTAKTIVEENDISKIYITKRNDFDIDFCISLEIKRVFIEIVLLADLNNYEFEYRKNLFEGKTFNTFCPFDKPIEKTELYSTLYDYAIENSDYMITYLKYDEDISSLITEKAKTKGVKVINIADYLPRNGVHCARFSIH